MGALAAVLGILGGLCSIMGIITAVKVIPEFVALTWMFWLVLGAILILGCIAALIGRGGGYE